MNVLGRMIVDSTAATRNERLRVDLRLAVVADTDEWVGLFDRVLFGHAVHRGRRDQQRATDAGLLRRDEDVLGAADVDRADLRARGLDRERGRGVHDDVGARDEPANRVEIADVAAKLVDRAFEPGVVERRHVERAHVVAVGEKPSREVQAEESRAAGDCVQHRAYASWQTRPAAQRPPRDESAQTRHRHARPPPLQSVPPWVGGGLGWDLPGTQRQTQRPTRAACTRAFTGWGGGFEFTSTAASNRIEIPTRLSPIRLRGSRCSMLSWPRSSAGRATK